MVGKTFYGPLTYFEILVGLAFYIFADKKVDYAVMETGLGGKYDGTNVVSRSDKLAVLTKIGLDHTNILGKTIEEITLQKAMIINEKSQAISTNQDPRAEKVIRKVAKNQKARLFFVPPMSRLQSPFKDVINRLDPLLQGDDNTKQIINNCGLIGEYQKENANLALTAVNYLSQRDGFKIDQEKVKTVFQTAHFPGRFDIKKIKNKTVIFDGAHNPQKMEAFISSLIKKYPDKKFNFLLAFKKGKDYEPILKHILPYAQDIIVTSFDNMNQGMGELYSEDPQVIGDLLKEMNYFYYQVVPDLKDALKKAQESKHMVVITGSLYLIGEVYNLMEK
jgi:dihydrofolate synthase/folylpolyglutamate synthase